MTRLQITNAAIRPLFYHYYRNNQLLHLWTRLHRMDYVNRTSGLVRQCDPQTLADPQLTSFLISTNST